MLINVVSREFSWLDVKYRNRPQILPRYIGLMPAKVKWVQKRHLLNSRAFSNNTRLLREGQTGSQ